MQKALIRLCILGCVLGAILSPAAAYCSQPGSAHDQCHHIGSGPGSIQCEVGSTGKVHFSQSSWLKATDFSHSCLADAAVNCASKKNAATPGDPTASCCSCFLYAKYCANKPGQFVTNNDPTNSDHTLVMPASACTGVENWYNQGLGCPGEAIWDEAEKLLSGAHRNALWGMAINPVGRRGQHQMHVHLAQVSSSFLSAVTDGVDKKQTQFYVNCHQSAPKLDKCSYSPNKCSNCPEVLIKNAAQPSGAAPFATVYGPPNNPDKPNTLHASTLVLRLPRQKYPNTWAVVINKDGPAECFFAATKESCN